MFFGDDARIAPSTITDSMRKSGLLYGFHLWSRIRASLVSQVGRRTDDARRATSECGQDRGRAAGPDRRRARRRRWITRRRLPEGAFVRRGFAKTRDTSFGSVPRRSATPTCPASHLPLASQQTHGRLTTNQPMLVDSEWCRCGHPRTAAEVTHGGRRSARIRVGLGSRRV